MTGREKFLSRIVEPDAFFILLIVGVLGLYTEFTHPGMFAPGVIGGIAILLALFAMHMLPVNFTGLLLIVLALALFVLEAKFPTHGVLGVGGVVSMILGALMLVRSPMTGMGVSLGTALGVAIPFAVIVIILMRLVLRSRSWKPATGKEELARRRRRSHRAGRLRTAAREWCASTASCGARRRSRGRNSERRARKGAGSRWLDAEGGTDEGVGFARRSVLIGFSRHRSGGGSDGLEFRVDLGSWLLSLFFCSGFSIPST